MNLLAILVALLFLYSLVSSRLEKTVLTTPIVFTVGGMLALLCMPGLRHRQGGLEVLLRLAEVGLVLLLFTEASRTDLKLLKSSQNLPVRLLSIGMLLTILLGAICAKVVFHLHRGSRHSGCHPGSNRRRTWASNRREPPRACTDQPGPKRGSRTQ